MTNLDRTILELSSGIRWYPTADTELAFGAGDGTETLRSIASCIASGRPFPVWSGGSGRTLFSSPEVNWANRAWHDATHCTVGTDFSLDGEVATVQAQCRQIQGIAGAENARLYWADGVGQQHHFYRFGRFPIDQHAFCLDYARNGCLSRPF